MSSLNCRLSRLFAASLLVASCCAFAASGPAAPSAVDNPSGPQLNPAYMNRSVNPGDDFYEYSCGTWQKDAKIAPDRADTSPGEPMYDQHEKLLNQLITDLAKSNPAAGTSARKIVDLYNSSLDESAVEAKGLAPLRPHLDAIIAIHDKKQLSHLLGETLRADEDALNNSIFYSPNLFGLWVAPGFHDSTHYVPYLMQGGLMMPDREYYISDSEEMKKTRASYRAHVEKMFSLAGLGNASARAEHVIDIETAIAHAQWSLADSNDVHKADNPWKKSDFAAKAPGLDWDEYFRGAGLDGQQEFMVWQPGAITGESALVGSASVEAWKDWLAFHLIDVYGSRLPKAFAEESFNFYGKVLGGVNVQSPRWERSVNTVNSFLADEVGRIYVAKYFPPAVKAQVQSMVANLIAVYRTRIQALSWMAPSTKKEALAKLDTLYVGVGYGETWHDYSNFEVKPGDLFGNIWRGSVANYQRQRALIGKQVDKKEWQMAPQTINAVNLPLQNALNFPAAILQAPSFDPKAPAAANYGAIGAVIGHEISHTFDSSGAEFDSQGSLRNWWTPADYAHFKAETQKLVDQYSRYKPFPDLALNGEQTLAENLADDAGLTASYAAYMQSLHGEHAPVIDGFNGDQQFFIAYAQSWADKLRPEALRQEVMTDTHSPGPWRALTVRNIDAWYTAFDVNQGDKLYLAPADRVQIW